MPSTLGSGSMSICPPSFDENACGRLLPGSTSLTAGRGTN